MISDFRGALSQEMRGILDHLLPVLGDWRGNGAITGVPPRTTTPDHCRNEIQLEGVDDMPPIHENSSQSERVPELLDRRKIGSSHFCAPSDWMGVEWVVGENQPEFHDPLRSQMREAQGSLLEGESSPLNEEVAITDRESREEEANLRILSETVQRGELLG